MRFRFSINGINYNSINDFGDWTVVIFSIAGFFLLLSLAFKIVSRWIYFKKCGEEGWKSLIPIYTDITLVKISGLNWWWVLFLYITVIQSIVSFTFSLNGISYMSIISSLLSILGLASLFAKFNIGYNICKKFNVSVGYAVLITLLEPVGLLILGLSKNMKYDKDLEVSPNGIFKSNTTNNNQYKAESTEFCENCGSKLKKDAVYCEKCGNKVK